MFNILSNKLSVSDFQHKTRSKDTKKRTFINLPQERKLKIKEYLQYDEGELLFDTVQSHKLKWVIVLNVRAQ